ncbi:MAG: D-alanine--D-alanine ligase [Halioglobus sp.]
MTRQVSDISGTIALLCGGTSAEREVSLNSGATVFEALESLGYTVTRVDPAQANWIAQIQDSEFVFNALHGPGGEDGVMQGSLEMLGKPYTGSRVLGSALAMDKKRSKQLWQGIGLPTGGFETLTKTTDWQAVISRYGKVFVKPACEGSSIGMSSASTAEELKAAFANAADYAGDVIAEQFIDGPEYTVAVLGEQTLPSIRMETGNEFYDYDAKYLSNDTVYHCPSDLNAEDEAQLSSLALAAFSSLGCSIWGRVDFMRDSDGQFYILEVNTIPGMTSHSLVPMAAAAVGLDIAALVGQIVKLSWEECHVAS